MLIRGSCLIGLTIFSTLAAFNVHAHAYNWRGNVIELFQNLEAACQADYELRKPDPQVEGCMYYTTYSRCEKNLISGTDPPTSANDTATIKVFFYIHGVNEVCGILSPEQEFPLKSLHGEFLPDEYYITVDPETSTEPSSCSSDQKPVHVGDPINPANGGVYTTHKELSTQSVAGSLSCSRFYNSLNEEDQGLGVGWRHIFSRSVIATNQSVSLKPYVAIASNSSLYGDPTAACITGFSEVKYQVSAWSNSTATYSNGICTLTRNGVNVGTLRIYSAGSVLPVPSATTAVIEVTRDDGQVIRFSVINGIISGPPGTSMKVSQTASGFTLTDGSDNVEVYDTSGKLLSISSRTGVVQTLNYDASGRLGSVTDNFGHQLTLSYDAQNRLISVTRQ